jgi:hypothetical protein
MDKSGVLSRFVFIWLERILRTGLWCVRLLEDKFLVCAPTSLSALVPTPTE